MLSILQVGSCGLEMSDDPFRFEGHDWSQEFRASLTDAAPASILEISLHGRPKREGPLKGSPDYASKVCRPRWVSGSGTLLGSGVLPDALKVVAHAKAIPHPDTYLSVVKQIIGRNLSSMTAL
jgi:hypothetical protein